MAVFLAVLAISKKLKKRGPALKGHNIISIASEYFGWPPATRSPNRQTRQRCRWGRYTLYIDAPRRQTFISLPLDKAICRFTKAKYIITSRGITSNIFSHRQYWQYYYYRQHWQLLAVLFQTY